MGSPNLGANVRRFIVSLAHRLHERPAADDLYVRGSGSLVTFQGERNLPRLLGRMKNVRVA